MWTGEGGAIGNGQGSGDGQFISGGTGLPNEIGMIERDEPVEELPIDVRGKHQGDDAVVEAADVPDKRIKRVRGEDENERPFGNPGGESVRPQPQLGIGYGNAVIGDGSRPVER